MNEETEDFVAPRADRGSQYHVRSTCGVTADWLTTREKAIELAEKEGLEVYEIVGSRSTRIYPCAA